jgi:hypothetical protein
MAAAEEHANAREALIVAADAYEDGKLRALRAPARDAAELARVLGDPEVGDFRVGVSLNEPDHVVRRKLSEFFADRGRDDLLLLHISCHGLKDEDGTLYFASSNTIVEHLEATAIPSEFVNRQMTRSRSRRIVLLLDCCFGGAFARGMVHRAGESVAIKEEFDGQGRIVLTASRAMEYAFEGDTLEGEARPSIFTSAIVEGLESGHADRDRDSRVSVDELYDYVYDRVREATPNQTPSKWTFDVQGDLYIARSPTPAVVEPSELPLELRAAMESPFANVRAGAVEELAHLLAGTHAGFAEAARIALEALAEDDSKRVSEAAERALGVEPPELTVAYAPPAPPVPVLELAPPPPPQQPASPPAPRAPARRRSTSASRLAVLAARAARRQDALALAGAALLVLGYFRSAGWGTGWSFATGFEEDIWLIWQPLEAFGAALLVGGAVAARRTGRAGRHGVDGLLLAVGLVVCIAMLCFVGSSLEVRGFGTAVLTTLGAMAIAASGALGVVTRRAPEATVSRRGVVIAAAGAVLTLVALVVDIGNWSKSALVDGISGDWALPVFLEVATAAGLALLMLLVLAAAPRWRLHAGGALVGLGTLTALHVAGVVVHIAKFEGAGALRWGGVIGIAGGLLLVAAGASVVRADRPVRAPAATGLPAT